MRSATIDELPCAMLANGPAWTKHGVPSVVCIRVGLIASRMMTVAAPAHRASSAVIALPVRAVAEDRLPDALAHVHEAVGQRQDRHQLARDRDVEARAAGDAVLVAAEPDQDVAHRAVVDVDDAPPRDPRRVEAEAVLQQDRGVDVGRDQVVRRLHRVDVARQVEVELLHRDHLAHAAARRAALDPEERPHRGLAQAGEDLLAEPSRARATRRSCGPSSPRRAASASRPSRRRSGRWRPAFEPLERGERDLRLVVAVGLDLGGEEARLRRDRRRWAGAGWTARSRGRSSWVSGRWSAARRREAPTGGRSTGDRRAGAGPRPRRLLRAAYLIVVLSVSLAPARRRPRRAGSRPRRVTRLPGGDADRLARGTRSASFSFMSRRNSVGRGRLAGARDGDAALVVADTNCELGRQRQHDLQGRRRLRRDVVLDLEDVEELLADAKMPFSTWSAGPCPIISVWMAGRPVTSSSASLCAGCSRRR